jgi:hypothetical protein
MYLHTHVQTYSYIRKYTSSKLGYYSICSILGRRPSEELYKNMMPKKHFFSLESKAALLKMALKPNRTEFMNAYKYFYFYFN